MVKLNCKICSEEYDNTNHKPTCLFDCSHTYCLNCVDVKKLSKCPECKKQLKGSNTNWEILEIIELTTNDKLDLSCKICFEQFNDSDNTPHVLFNCTHTFCIDCITTFSETDKSCPTCKAQIQSSSVNFELLDIILKSYYEDKKDLIQFIKEAEIGFEDQIKKIQNKKSSEINDLFKGLKAQVVAKSDDIVKVLNLNKKKLLEESKRIESNTKDSLKEYSQLQKDGIKIYDYEEISERNFDVRQLHKLINDYKKKKHEYEHKIKQIQVEIDIYFHIKIYFH